MLEFFLSENELISLCENELISLCENELISLCENELISLCENELISLCENDPLSLFYRLLSNSMICSYYVSFIVIYLHLHRTPSTSAFRTVSG